MRLSISFSELADAVRKMGASSIPWTSKAESMNPPDIKEILAKGILEVNIEDVESDDRELLTYKGEQVLLYIKDTKQTRDILENHVRDARRFHVAECRTLEQMRNDNRYDRYVVTRNTSGDFEVEYDDTRIGGDRGETTSRLMVCKNCLHTLNYKGYACSYDNIIWEEFDIKEFLETYQTNFVVLPRYTDETAPRGGYSDSWLQESRDYRESVHWKCESCKVDLSSNKNLLDTHHRNAVTRDDRMRNLQALCKLCHQKQPRHSSYYVKPRAKATIEKLRQEQEIRPDLDL